MAEKKDRPTASPLESVTVEEYHRHRDRRFGTANPERMDNPFWEAMIRTSAGAFHATQRFLPDRDIFDGRPVWCFDRIGMSATLLEDHSIVFIGGEHEDYYDPDFCIYNEVIVRRWDGSIEIYGYPADVFPPTDFHSATLVEDEIYIIGRLGYGTERVLGTTPIFLLDLYNMQIKQIEPPGEEPGWISRHDALYLHGEHSIVVYGGKLLTLEGDRVQNERTWKLDLESLTWKEVDMIKLDTSASSW
jgi:hypothetical protein